MRLRWSTLLFWGGGLVFLGTLGAAAGKVVVPMATKLVGNAAWAKRVFDATAALGLSVRARLLVVAHAAFESGWGKSRAATVNNLFNLTAGAAWRGPTLVVPNADLSYSAAECQRLGRPMTPQANGQQACRIDQTWRSYPTLEAALRDYWDFLGPTQNRGRYVTARAALERGDAAGFSEALFTAGYFTLPAPEYASRLTSVLTTVCNALGVC